MLFHDEYYNSNYDKTIKVIVANDDKGLKSFLSKKFDIELPDWYAVNENEGLTFYSQKNHCFFVIFYAHSLSLDVIIHECTHLMQMVLQFINLYDHNEDPNNKSMTTMEAEAYFMSAVTCEIYGRVKHLINRNMTHITRLVRIKN